MKMSGEEGKKDGGGGTNTPLPLSARGNNQYEWFWKKILTNP